MLEAKDISYSIENRTILDKINFSVCKNEKVVLIGDNGSGKSTLALIMAGLIEPDSGIVSVETNREHTHSVSVILQNPEDSLITSSVERELAFPLENQAIHPDEIHQRIYQTAKDFDLLDKLSISPNNLSGGMKSRLALASVMITEPEFVILDEPASYLDYPGKKLLFEYLDMMIEKGTGIILITQNKYIQKWGDRIFHLDNCKLEEIKISDLDENYSIKNNDYSSDRSIVKFDSVNFSYDGDRVLHDINFDVHEGESIALLGSSGSGKSTLVNLISKLFLPDNGSIQSEGRKGIIFQFPEMQIFEQSVIDDVMFGPNNYKIENPRQESIEALKLFGIDESYWDRNPHMLSLGEIRKVGAAGVLALKPDLLVFDEPSVSLDRKGKMILINIIKKIISAGKSIITVSHDLEFISHFVNRAIVLQDGNIVYDNCLKELIDSEEQLKHFGLGYDKWLFD